jgi:tetratricopeptide (TPR) repeat protein
MNSRRQDLLALPTLWVLAALVLAACATTRTTPQQDYTYDLGRNCETATTRIEGFDADGRYRIFERGVAASSNSPEFQRFVACMTSQFQTQSILEWLKAHETQTPYRDAIPRAREALARREQALGPTNPELVQSLNDLSYLLQAAGDYAAARPLSERALRIQERALGPTHLAVVAGLNNLANLLRRMGDYAGARPLYERALRIYEQALGTNHPTLARSLHNLAALLETMGDPAAARPLYERALRIQEQALGPTHPDVAVSLNNFANLLRTMGDYAGARPLYERALRIYEQALGPTHPAVAEILISFASLLQTTRDYAGARPLYERALRIQEQALGPTHPDVAMSLDNLANLLQSTGDSAGARPLHERSLRIREQALGPTHPDVAQSLTGLANLLRTTGDYAGARPLYERALRIREQALGPTHPDVAASLNNFASLLQTTEDYAGARPLYERARLVDLALSRANVELEDEALRGLRRSFDSERALRRYVRLLAAVARKPQRDPGLSAPAATAFMVAEQSRSGSAQAALHRAGARAAAGNVASAGLARQVQELRDRLAATRKQLVTEYGRPAAERDAARLAAVQQEAVRLDQELQAATGRLRSVFPRYAELAMPEPIDVSGAQALLRDDEALLGYFVLENRLLVWVLRPGRLAYHDETLSARELTALVRRVRQSADQTRNLNLDLGQLMPFDVVGAHELYQRLFEPIAMELRGVKQLIVVPDGALLALPFGMLVTKTDGESFQQLATLYAHGSTLGTNDLIAYGQLAWLAREYAITVLPSATSLRALRQIARARGTEIESFIGFGDPVFEGGGRERGGTMVAARGSAVNVAELRKLNRLPGTRAELLAMAKALRADPAEALYLDVRATKPQVISLNGTGRLGRVRVLSFATHGLLTPIRK